MYLIFLDSTLYSFINNDKIKMIKHGTMKLKKNTYAPKNNSSLEFWSDDD